MPFSDLDWWRRSASHPPGWSVCRRLAQIDPVGAGDAFCAGVLSGLLDGLPLRDSVTRGVALGAFCVSTFGDYQGLPDRNGLKAFMEGTVTPGR
jgi:2-dehydro-3-deoxygluconokinase